MTPSELTLNMEAAGYDPAASVSPRQLPPGCRVRLDDFTVEHRCPRSETPSFAVRRYQCRRSPHVRAWLRCTACDWLTEL